MSHLRRVYLYDSPDTAGLDIAEVAAYLGDLMPTVATHVRTDYLTHHLAKFNDEQVEVLARELAARLKEREVTNLVFPDDRGLLPPVRPEERDLQSVYPADALQEVVAPLLPRDERGSGKLHLVFVSQCIGQWNAQLRQFSLGIIQPGEPTLISTSGIVEAPKPPREYSFRRAQLVAFGLGEALEYLDEQFAAETLIHGDPRITEAAKGYGLQSVFHHLFGQAGCEEPMCRLYEAATADEMAAAQLGAEAALCERHARMLREALPESD